MEKRADKITFITWLWQGWRNVYDTRNVLALRGMLKDYAPDHNLCVVTDTKIELPDDVLVYPLWEHPLPNPSGMKQNCFARLKLFDKDFALRFGQRLVSIDLDVVIQDDIRPLFSGEPYFRAIRGESSLYNGSMWELRAGTMPGVWDEFIKNPQGAADIILRAKELGMKVNGSDQGWMSYVIDENWAEFWDESDGIMHFSQKKYYDVRDELRDARMICFAGSTKPWDPLCEKIAPTVYKHYMKYYSA